LSDSISVGDTLQNDLNLPKIELNFLKNSRKKQATIIKILQLVIHLSKWKKVQAKRSVPIIMINGETRSYPIDKKPQKAKVIPVN
jgi:hypothetical protein